jgi:hypothetical protein
MLLPASFGQLVSERADAYAGVRMRTAFPGG